MTPIVLELFGCREPGMEKPPDEPPPEPPPPTFLGEPGNWMDSNAMPLVSVSERETFSDRIQRFRGEENNVGFQQGSTHTRSLANSPETITFTEYSVTHSSSQKVDVYALTSGYLHLLNGNKSYSEILGGAVPNAGEEILVLKSLPSILNSWPTVQPGEGALLKETAYFNLEIDFAALLEQIPKSTTDKFHKSMYRRKTGSDWSGAPDDWPAAYLDLFLQFADVPIIVQGGAKIGFTTANTPSGQRLSMDLRMGDRWTLHEEDVKAFFKHHQRNYGLAGHPLIAKLIGRSVPETAVDIIPVEYDVQAGYPAVRRKHKLGQDFASFATVVDPEYDPLALDLDQAPYPHLVVQKPPTVAVPPYLVSFLSQQTWSTKLKISNPTAQTITIDGFVPTEMSITPLTNSTALEPIFEISVLELPPNNVGLDSRFININVNGTVAQVLNVTFMDFHTVPIRFHKLIDKDPATGNVLHQADMDSAKLEEVLAYANQILGRQTNVYLYPVAEGETILHDFVFDFDLGDPIRKGSANTKGTQDIYQACLPTPFEAIKVIFVWDQEVGESVGVTIFPDSNSWGMILVDTSVYPAIRSLGATPRSVPQMAKTLVHELGHWFAVTFESVKGGFPPCTHGQDHFDHFTRTQGIENAGCDGGDWSFYGNVMQGGETPIFITFEQAIVYYSNASSVVP